MDRPTISRHDRPRLLCHPLRLKHWRVLLKGLVPRQERLQQKVLLWGLVPRQGHLPGLVP